MDQTIVMRLLKRAAEDCDPELVKLAKFMESYLLRYHGYVYRLGKERYKEWFKKFIQDGKPNPATTVKAEPNGRRWVILYKLLACYSPEDGIFKTIEEDFNAISDLIENEQMPTFETKEDFLDKLKYEKDMDRARRAIFILMLNVSNHTLEFRGDIHGRKYKR